MSRHQDAIPRAHCRDFRRVRLAPGQQAEVELRLVGDNLENMLLGSEDNNKPSLIGSLELEVGGQSTSLPKDAACLLTEPAFPHPS